MFFTEKRFYIFGLALVAFFLFLNSSGVFENVELRMLDLFRRSHAPHPDIVIVAIDNKSIQEIGRWPWDRKVHAHFLNSLRNANPKLVAYDINFFEPQDNINDSAFNFAIQNSKFPTVLSAQAIFMKGLNTPESVLKPITISPHIGHINVSESEDGIAREFPKSFSVNGEAILPFSFKIAEISGAEIPEDDGLLIDFAGSAGTFQTISYTDILNRKINTDELQDKILIVGATASDLQDYLLAPVPNNILSGAEWHANAVHNILLNKGTKTVNPIYPISLGILLWLFILFIPPYIKTETVAKIFAILIASLPISSFILWQFQIAFPFFTNLLGLSFIFIGRSFYIWYKTEVEKRRLHRTIQNRFSPQVVEAIMRDPKLLKLGGERKEVTVLFSDIRSFTTISESIAPETLSLLLHEYFTEMTEEVLESNGVLDKFIGDAVMAFWGAPLEQKDQADRAVTAALGMLKRLKVLQEKWAAKGWPFVDIGVGIHSGVVTVGNMGSEKRFDYTVIGDAVNAASRLEGLNKEYKTHIIVSEATLNKLTIKVESKPLGEVLVKGKTQGINIYQILEN